MTKLYKVGIYCRLSVDDASNSAKANYIPSDESVSIENQYEILSKFTMLNGWTEVKTYRDDGYSGGILTPRWYWTIHYGDGSCKYSKLWMYATVKNILNSEVYLGSLIQNRTDSRSYKDSTMIYKPESEWICHETCHEAIITNELWEAAQEVNRKASKIAEGNTPPTPCLFTGKLVCADCKAPLVANRERHQRKNGTVKTYTSYYCSRHANSGRSSCTRHVIYEGTLKELLLGEIRAQAEAL